MCRSGSACVRPTESGSHNWTRAPPLAPQPHSTLPRCLMAFLNTAARPRPRPAGILFPKPGPVSSTASRAEFCLPANLDRHGAGRSCRAGRVVHQVRHHPAKQHWVNVGEDGAGRADHRDFTRPRHAFRGGYVPGDTHQVGSAGTRRVRCSKLQRVLDQLCQPLGLLGHLLQPGAGARRQAGLGQRGSGQREHAGEWLAHVVAVVPQDLHDPRVASTSALDMSITCPRGPDLSTSPQKVLCPASLAKSVQNSLHTEMTRRLLPGLSPS